MKELKDMSAEHHHWKDKREGPLPTVDKGKPLKATRQIARQMIFGRCMADVAEAHPELSRKERRVLAGILAKAMWQALVERQKG